MLILTLMLIRMVDLFLEYLSEEIPSRMQSKAADNLNINLSRLLVGKNISFGDATTYYSACRLSINIKNVSIKQPDSIEERRGPREGADYAAIDGFKKSLGISGKHLEKRETSKGVFWFGNIKTEGALLAELIPKIINDLTLKFPWPKSQRWGEGKLRWIRPLRRVNVIFDNKPIIFNIGQDSEIITSNITEGHKFLSNKKIQFLSFDEYTSALKKYFVIPDPIKRKKLILSQINRIVSKNNLVLIKDDKLIEEVNGLVEWPNVIIGSIEKKFMILPKEVLVTAMRVHQKYFSLQRKDGILAPFFLTISNMPKKKSRDDNIRFGNERVLRARLEDAKFFWENDQSIKFSERIKDLKTISFFNELGNLYEKSKRISKLGKVLAGYITNVDHNDIERAGLLCKIDLLTGMVNEFPELQGVMGGYYSKNENNNVSIAINQHYQPQGIRDIIPTSTEGKIISLADKIDSLVGLFSVGAFPTGSKDPYGLRRAALGIIRIIIEGKLTIHLSKVIKSSSNLYLNCNKNVVSKVENFIQDRLKVYLKDQNISHDVVSCILGASSQFDLFDCFNRAKTLNKFLSCKMGTDLKVLWLRISSILNAEEKKSGENIIFRDGSNNNYSDYEKELIDKLNSLKIDKNYQMMLEQRLSLRKYIDKYFELFTINDPNSKIRKSRFEIIALTREKMLDIGNLNNLEG